MEKFFNTAGFCRPEMHYMVEPTRGLYPAISQLIRQQQFFLLHAPRQTGKTTLLHSLAHKLNREGQYISVVFSVEMSRYPSATVEDSNQAAIGSLHSIAKLFLPENEMPPPPRDFPRSSIALFEYLSAWSSSQTKPIVLLVDEVDALQDSTLLSLLSQMRNGFQNRPKHFPASVALVGLRDIRGYRIRAREGQPSTGSGSPFNVKTESFFLNFFTKKEVDDLLSQHTATTGQQFSRAVRAKIFEYSDGQPWLVNSLANKIVSGILGKQVVALEIKIRPNLRSREGSLRQLAGYLDRLGQPHGYLVIFDKTPSSELAWDERIRWAEEEFLGKKMTVLEL